MGASSGQWFVWLLDSKCCSLLLALLANSVNHSNAIVIDSNFCTSYLFDRCFSRNSQLQLLVFSSFRWTHRLVLLNRRRVERCVCQAR